MRFTVRRPASAEVSPCWHRPSGGDVACSVYVGVARPCGAGDALKHRLALAVVGCDVPTGGASLRRVRSWDLFDPAVSLVLQTGGEHAPAAGVDGPVQSAFLGDAYTGPVHGSSRTAGHTANVECFDADRVETPRDVGGGLFDPVLAAGTLTGFEFRDRQLRAGSPTGATLGAGQALLKHPEPGGLTAAQPGNMQQLTSRQRCRHDNPSVDTHHAGIIRPRDVVGDIGEPDMPAAGPIPGDPVGLHPFGDRPRQTEPHPADLGHPYPTEPAVQPLDMMRFDRHLPKPFMHPGLMPPRAMMRPSEEVAHRLREVPQRLLLHGLRTGRQPGMLGAGRSQLGALLVVARSPKPRPPVLLLLNGQIPHIAGVPTMSRQLRGLYSGGKQPISRHPANLTAPTDTEPKGGAAFPPPAKAGGFHAAKIP